MHAAVVTDFTQPPRYGTFREPVEDAEHRVVRVLAAGVHQIVRGRAAGRHYSSGAELPIVAGIDCVASTESGERVYTGGCPDPFGTLAELAPVPRGWAVGPDALDDATAAALPNPACSSWLPLEAALAERPGGTVLVHGATGVAGLLAVQTARLLGAGRVLAAGRSASGLRTALERGADAAIRLDDPLADQLTDAAPDGVDVIVDYLWGGRTRDLLLALVPAERRPNRPVDLIEIGAAAGSNLPLDAAWLRSRPLRIRGSGLGSVRPASMAGTIGRVLDAAASGRLRIDIVTAPLAEVEHAWDEPGRLVLIP